MSRDPLNPTITITSENIFEQLKDHIIKFQKMPMITIRYVIGNDTYYSFINAFRVSYSYGYIDGFILYSEWNEITGIGSEDRQSVMLKVEIGNDSQSGSAKIRLPQHLYEHTINIKSRLDSMSPIYFEVQMKLIRKYDTIIDSLTKLTTNEFGDFEGIIKKLITNGVLINDGVKHQPILLRKEDRGFNIQLQYETINESGQFAINYTPTFVESNVIINDDVNQIV